MSDSASRLRLARAAKRLARATQSPPLVLMTDDERLPDPLTAVRALPRGSMVIVRSRDAQRRASLVMRLRPVARARGLKLLMAGEHAPGTDGVHLPEARIGDAAGLKARHCRFITASAHSLAALRKASHVDVLFLSPVFPTGSHPGRACLGPLRANMMARLSRRPVYALGGVTARNAGLLSGFAGIAAIGALAV